MQADIDTDDDTRGDHLRKLVVDALGKGGAPPTGVVWRRDRLDLMSLQPVAEKRIALPMLLAGLSRSTAEDAGPVSEQQGQVAVLNLMGTIAPRASAVRDVSAAFTSLERFQAAFREAASDTNVTAIVLNVDSPGGMVDLVPEAAATIRNAKKECRPIYAVANTTAASAAYWIASQADQFYATPSALVGSIGVRAMHVDESAALKRVGFNVTHVYAGSRKVEGNQHEPLSKQARAALQEQIDDTYALFVADVAGARGVPETVVRADPEAGTPHMGGGRVYHAKAAADLNMVDGIATFEEVVAMARSRRARPRTSLAEARLALL